VADRDVAGLFARAAVVGMPYREASQSGVAALAAGFGRPVVATAVPGLTDSVEHGVTGLLVAPGSIDELADALVRVLNDGALAARLGEGAFAAARSRLSWSTIAEAHRRIYWATWLIHNGEGVSVPSGVQ
jgi:glycosyltransferase involved in cell wall biosynthesis